MGTSLLKRGIFNSLPCSLKSEEPLSLTFDIFFFADNADIHTSLAVKPTTPWVILVNTETFHIYFQDWHRTCEKTRLQSQSSGTIAAMSAERNTSPFGLPSSRSSATLEACLPGGSECSCCMKLKQGSFSAAGADTEQERSTGITRRKLFTYSRAYEEWLPDVSLNSSRLAWNPESASAEEFSRTYMKVFDAHTCSVEGAQLWDF